MGIRISERTDLFHVPYGSVNSEGTPEASFVDVKANPAWIPVLPSCVGWPETRHLLQILNDSTSSLMSLAADQAYVDVEQPSQDATLTSFVTMCFADMATNTKQSMSELAEYLKRYMDQELQNACNVLQRSLALDVVLEIQPTVYHLVGIEGWSLSVLIAADGPDKQQTRDLWRLCMTILGRGIIERERGQQDRI